MVFRPCSAVCSCCSLCLLAASSGLSFASLSVYPISLLPLAFDALALLFFSGRTLPYPNTCHPQLRAISVTQRSQTHSCMHS
ncbi:hypothetical protein EDB80DRAFT_718388 [Ilyonectria destructans]|nr:hypothetical protein EDB80DRAFT_718388 [Ilyonectria destructans]